MQNTNVVTMSANERMAALKQRANVTPEFENWKPSEGETLLGEIVGGDVFQHPLYGEQKIMKVKSENGVLLNVFLNRWLLNALESFAATTGDFIALTFKGKKKAANGNWFNAYQLDVEKA
jgi:hypothetical protein